GFGRLKKVILLKETVLLRRHWIGVKKWFNPNESLDFRWGFCFMHTYISL
ncbi:MAG: hypothetical protein ACI8V7_000001, partial [Candidatus Paceibacteria bacterium]